MDLRVLWDETETETETETEVTQPVGWELEQSTARVGCLLDDDMTKTLKTRQRPSQIRGKEAGRGQGRTDDRL